MIKYRNISLSAKTFYGVKFEPGEVKEVPGFINCQGLVRVFDDSSKTSSAPKRVSEDPMPTHTRGRKKKVSEPEKVQIAETETKLETQEEISDGNPS